MLSLRKLEILVQVAEQGQITRVAQTLGLSQSAVSMALASLEELHGEPLFHRRGRRLLLNEQGRQLLPLARRRLHDVDNFKRALHDSHQQSGGHLHVGASTTIGNYLLPQLVAQFSRRYPQAKIKLQIGNSEQIAHGVQEGELDLGLIEGPCHLAELACQPWRDDELVVIVAPDHPWAQGAALTRGQLQTGAWIMREAGSGTREVFEAAWGRGSHELASLLELGHTEAIKKAVQAGLGVSCLSRLAVATELAQGWLVAVKTPLHLGRQLSLIRSPDRYQGRLLRGFLALLHESAAEADKNLTVPKTRTGDGHTDGSTVDDCATAPG